jgi:NAD(P)-dependent dehydrogenase (short-subunit alcohol dehydrogenase family)
MSTLHGIGIGIAGSEEESMGVLEGKRALVTGSGTGIGRAIAREFAREGAAVALHYSHSDKGARTAVEEILAAGGKAAALRADFTRRDQVRGLAGEAVSFLGGIDILVNCAGVTMTLPFEEVTDEQFDLLYDVNVAAPFFLTQALLPRLRESKAAVINFSSIHAFEAYPEHTVYAGTRGAIVSFTRVLAIELAPYGIRVNGIAPGSTWVESHKALAPDADVVAAGRAIPAGFLAAPEDMARVAVFLASPASRFILGQTIVVDGGTTSWMPFGEGYLARSTPGFRLGKGYVPGI